jgi:hypothetical protein
VSASANCAVLLQVQRNGDSGSPRVVGSISASNAVSKAGSLAVNGRRPPPARRTRAATFTRCGGASRKSRKPA